MTFNNLDVRIQGSQADGWTVDLVGPRDELISAPFSWASDVDVASAVEGSQVLEHLGAGLFGALFPDRLRQAVVAPRAADAGGAGYRLRLHLPAAWAGLPWELMYGSLWSAAQASNPFQSATVRALLTDSFDAESLRRFCQDDDAFRPVLALLGAKFGLVDVIDALIGYCDERRLYPSLLTGVQRLNPRQYERYAGQFPPLTAAPPAEQERLTATYLALDPSTLVVRFADGHVHPSLPIQLADPMRLLYLARQLPAPPPTGQARLSLIPGEPTWAGLSAGLAGGCQAVHLAGHGTAEGGAACLVPEGDSTPMDGQALFNLLQGTGARLVVLAPATPATPGDCAALSRVAALLVEQGLPAAVAWSLPASPDSIDAFASSFYDALAGGAPLDTALLRGRKSVVAAEEPGWSDRADWAAAALFTSIPDCRLFEVPSRPNTIVQQAITPGDATVIGTIGDQATVMIGATRGLAGSIPLTPAIADPLPNLMGELRQLVRDRAPDARRAAALEKVAALKGAVEPPLDLDMIESILHWFEREVPQASYAVLSAILTGVEPRAEAAGDEVLLDFRRRFDAAM